MTPDGGESQLRRYWLLDARAKTDLLAALPEQGHDAPRLKLLLAAGAGSTADGGEEGTPWARRSSRWPRRGETARGGGT
jgi:hypothetical protein